jgi:hypothetical protein
MTEDTIKKSKIKTPRQKNSYYTQRKEESSCLNDTKSKEEQVMTEQFVAKKI